MIRRRLRYLMSPDVGGAIPFCKTLGTSGCAGAGVAAAAGKRGGRRGVRDERGCRRASGCRLSQSRWNSTNAMS